MWGEAMHSEGKLNLLVSFFKRKMMNFDRYYNASTKPAIFSKNIFLMSGIGIRIS
jgi:hypothetical protein